MGVKKFFGVNIVVKDLDAAAKKYQAFLGVKPEWTPPEKFAFPGMRGASFVLPDGVMINLITSSNPETSVSKFLERTGEGVFLISLRMEDLEQDMKALEAAGVKLTSPTPLAYEGGKVNFGHPKTLHGVQIEFIQPDK
ncbi:MAG: VOC family protein [Dehalococcoidia bacterium]|nr:VOC family protein [Dehalococcoidia bacterium]